MERILQDLRQAGRSLRRSPGFAVVAALTLALGIGGTVAIFTVVRGVLLRPLPYPAPERLVQLRQVGESGRSSTAWSEPNFRDVRREADGFEALTAFGNATVTLLGSGSPARIPGAFVSEDFFRVLGVEAARGRLLTEEDHRRRAPVVVVSDGFWQSSLGGDPSAVGSTVRLNDEAHTVVGILPPRTGFPASADFWAPRRVRSDASRTAHNWRVVGRLRPDVSYERAGAGLSALAGRLKARYGDDTWMVDAGLVSLEEEVVGGVRPALLVLQSAAVLLLIIAALNVTGLFLVRLTDRGRELSVRLALGATRRDLLRSVLSESLVLALVGGGLGVLLGALGVDVLLGLEPGRLPGLAEVRMDGAVLGFSLALTGVVALATGGFALLGAEGLNVREGLAEGGRGRSGAPGGQRSLQGLVALQMAFTVVLLVGGGLLTRSFLRVLEVDPGYRTGGAVVADVTLPTPADQGSFPFTGPPSDRRGLETLDRVLADIRSVSGIGDVGGVSAFPLAGGSGNGLFIRLEDPDEITTLEEFQTLARRPERTGYADFRVATPGYFHAMGIPVLEGRAFQEGDEAEGTHVAVVSRSLADETWPDRSPVGRWVQFGNMDGVVTPFRIVGVVGDVRQRSLEEDPHPAFYGNARQRIRAAGGQFHVVAGVEGEGTGLIPEVRRRVQAAAPESPVAVRTLEEVFSGELADRRFSLVLMGIFGALALILSALGLYGVISYVVAGRTREFGIRRALGAERAGVVGMVVRRGFAVAAVGLVLGFGGAVVGAGLLRSQLFGVGSLDGAAYGAVAAFVLCTTLAASWLPARRAARVEAVEALRME